MRNAPRDALDPNPANYAYGLTPQIVGDAVAYTHQILDSIDLPLIEGADLRLAEMVELANLSAIVGNVFRTGICRASNGLFAPNAPHTYPDLLANGPGASNVEIKVALEGNKPKGHLVKPGPHLTVRYVLADAQGNFTRGKASRGNVPWIWEVRIGHLKAEHFNFSNTDGDSGKTAVINAAGMNSLGVVYFDRARCPLVRGV